MATVGVIAIGSLVSGEIDIGSLVWGAKSAEVYGMTDGVCDGGTDGGSLV